MRQVKLATSFGNSQLKALRALVGNTMTTPSLGSALSTPTAIAVDPAGVYAYVCNAGNHKIYKITLDTAAVAVFAGDGTDATLDGTGAAARFSKPFGICIDAAGANLYVTEFTGHVIRKIVVSSGVVTTLAGGAGATGTTDDTGTAARFNAPYGIAITPNQLNLIVADYTNHRIRKIVISTGVVTTLGGNGTGADVDGVGTLAQFYNPVSVVVEPMNVYAYIGTRYGYHIRRMNLSSLEVTTIAGTGTAVSQVGYSQRAGLNYPIALALDSTGEYMYIAESNRIRRMNVQTQLVEFFVGSGDYLNVDGVGVAASLRAPLALAITVDDNDLWVTDTTNLLHKIT